MLLMRDIITTKSTVGQLFLNDKFECFTLEDVDRNLEAYPERKLKKETCIPRGFYKVVLSLSPKYKRVMPEVLYVPGFSGIRIHSGNTKEDTEGCILVGKTRKEDYVGQSRLAYDALFKKLSLDSDTQITLEIR
jgi:hypothetical protein